MSPVGHRANVGWLTLSARLAPSREDLDELRDSKAAG